MYSPKIKADLIPILYRLKRRLDQPMTEIVDDILRPQLTEMSTIFLSEEKEEYHEPRNAGAGVSRSVD